MSASRAPPIFRRLTASAIVGWEHAVFPFPSNLVPQGFITANAQEAFPQLTVNYLLLDFGGRAAAVEAAGQLSIAGNVAFTAAHQQLIFNVARAYFTLDGADAALRAARQGLADAKVVQQSAEALFGRGLDTIVDVQLARRGTAQAQYDLAQAAPILEARHIVKELGEGNAKVLALNGVNLTLHPGEFTLLMGPSGSGKTTLLSILGCILSPTSGTVTIAGESASNRTGEDLADMRRRHLGFIFQAYNLFPTLNALDNVKIALDVRGFSADEREKRAGASLDAVGLSHRLHSYPGTLSGGEKQRVAIARAIASSPSIVLADEPTSALDTENGHAIMELLQKLAKDERRTILAVTHDPRTIPYADRVIEIEDGRIIGQRKDAEEPENAVKEKKSGSGSDKNGQKRKQYANA